MARWARAAGLFLCVAGAALALPQAARGDAGWWGDLDKGQSVRLSDVVASPEAFRGRTITFVCVFHQREREFNPLRTRFNSDRYDNVSVWPDGKALWLASDFEKDFPFLYVDRKHPQRDDLFQLTVMTRLEVTGRIEAVLDGSPFIEMTAFRVTGHRLGKDVVDKMLSAETYARASDPGARDIAIDNAQSALEDVHDLAPIYAARIRTRLVELLKTAGRVTDAERVLAGERLGPLMTPVRAPGAADGFAAPTTPSESLPGTPVGEPGLANSPLAGAPIPGSENLPGMPTDVPAPAAPVFPRGGDLPGRSVDAPAPAPMPGSANLPGLPVDLPPVPGTTNLPGRPVDTPATPMPRLAPKGPPEPKSVRLRIPDAPCAPPPPAQAPTQAPAPAPGAVVFPPPVAVPAPEVVDPPLPPPAPGGKPPARRPRLAGVK